MFFKGIIACFCTQNGFVELKIVIIFNYNLFIKSKLCRFKPFLILNLITLKFYSMNKRIQKSQISIGLLMMCVIAMPALLFSSCKKKKSPPVAYYTVTFDSQGGSAVNPITGVKYGSTITLPANPTKAGFTFDGWCTDKEGKSSFSPTTTINSDLTLYAKWVEQLYTVTFDSQGGSAVNPITGVKYGSTINLPPAPTKAGFMFNRWFIDDNTFKNEFDKTTPVTADLTLYALWFGGKSIMGFGSDSFRNGSEIPPKHIYPYDGQAEYLNVSPQLNWGGAPKGTTSFLIIMEDFVGEFANWHVYNIPSDKLSLAEKDPWLSKYNNTLGYHGPDSRYRVDIKKFTYIIMIFALDLPPNYFKKNNVPTFIKLAKAELGSHILETASIRGTFTVK